MRRRKRCPAKPPAVPRPAPYKKASHTTTGPAARKPGSWGRLRPETPPGESLLDPACKAYCLRRIGPHRPLRTKACGPYPTGRRPPAPHLSFCRFPPPPESRSFSGWSPVQRLSRFSANEPRSLLFREDELSRGVLLLESCNLAILHHEFEGHVGELRRPETQALHLAQRNDWLARQNQRQFTVRRQRNANLHAAGRFVSACELRHQFRIDGIGPAGEYGLRFVQGHHGLIDISLRIRAEVDRPLAVLLVVRSVKPVIMEASHGESDLMKVELKLVVFQTDGHHAVSGVIVGALVSRKGVGRLGI